MEIERKYLMTELPFDISGMKKTEMEQSYISFFPTIRLRKEDSLYFLTTKGRGDLAHEELELEISKEEYIKLQEKVEGNIIKKTRYYIPLMHDLVGEFDVYHEDLAGLFTIEVEFSSIEEANSFQAPDWFGMDVTYEKKYKNACLAEFGDKA